jgi:hypothetical protein
MITIIVSGWGWLVLVIGLASYLLMALAVEAVFQDWNYFELHTWPKSAALWLAAIPLWPLGRYLNRPEEAERNEETQKQILERLARNSLFFIPIEAWSLIFLLAGVVLLLVR